MSHGLGQQLGRVVLACLACICGGAAAWADGNTIVAAGSTATLLDTSRDMLRAQRPIALRDFGMAGFSLVERRGDVAPAPQLDVSPILDGIFDFLNHHGVPLHPQHDENGDGPIGVYADFSVGAQMPAVTFHLGDRPIERIGAFYSNERGFRCAVSWPIERFTLRLEGGEDSELGYYGIAGLQWLDPRRPLAIGIGVPMNLRDTERGIGVVVQLRMTLE